MKSLFPAGPASGIETMQLINRKVYGSVFMALLIAMLVISVALVPYAVVYMTSPAVAWIISGCVLYVIGVFIVTVAFNVPMNQRLDAMNHESNEQLSTGLFTPLPGPCGTMSGPLRLSAAWFVS